MVKTKRVAAKRYFVSGRVQGVAFRAFAQYTAVELGLAGYARNLDDGRVEVYATGPAAQLELLKQRLSRGPLLARVEEQRRSLRENLSRLEPVLRMRGDAARGRQIFFGAKAACSSCHTIGADGGQVGPDLTAIGAIRSPHDLLEAIVLPSASFVPGHESYRVETKRDVYVGVLRERSPDAVVLITGPGDEIWIPRADILKMETSTVSLMPDGYDEVLTHGELADLLAYLRAQVSR